MHLICIGWWLFFGVYAKCTYHPRRDVELVYLVDGWSSVVADAFKSANPWFTNFREAVESGGSKLTASVVQFGGLGDRECFRLVHEPSEDLSSVESSLESLKLLATSDDQSNLGNTMAFATSLFSDRDPDEIDKLLVLLSHDHHVEWSEDISQPDLVNGEMNCGDLSPPTTDQIVEALDHKGVRVIQVVYNSKAQENVLSFDMKEGVYGRRDPSKSLLSSFQTTIQNVISKLNVMLEYTYCSKNLDVVAFIDMHPNVAAGASEYLGGLTNRMSCVLDSVGRSITSQIYVLNRGVDKCVEVRRGSESSMRVVEVASRENKAYNMEVKMGLSDHNSQTNLPYLQKSFVKGASKDKMGLLIYVPSDTPEFALESTGIKYESNKCNRPNGSVEDIFKNAKNEIQETLILVSPELPNARQVYEQYVAASRHGLSGRIYVTNPEANFEDEVERVFKMLQRSLGSYVYMARDRIVDPKAGVEIQFLIDSNVNTDSDSHAKWGLRRGLFGATSALCPHFLHGHRLRSRMVEIGVSQEQGCLRHTLEWGPLHYVAREHPLMTILSPSYSIASCGLLRELVEVADSFSPFSSIRTRKIIVLSSDGEPKAGQELVQYEDEKCLMDTGCPSIEQIRVAFELADVSVYALSVKSTTTSKWSQFFKNLPVDYFKTDSKGTYEIEWWNRLKNGITNLGFFTSVLSCPETPSSDIDIFLLSDSSHTLDRQLATTLAASSLQRELNSFISQFGIKAKYALFSSGLIDSDTCFVKQSGLSESIDIYGTTRTPVDNSDSDEVSFLAAAHHIATTEANVHHTNLLLYASDKHFEENTEIHADRRDPFKCPVQLPTLQAAQASCHEGRLGVIVGVGITSAPSGLSADWKFALKDFPPTGNIIDIAYSRRTWAYNAFMSVASSVCGGVYDPEETAKIPGLLDAVKKVAPLVLGIGVSAGIAFGSLALWKIFQPPRQLSFTMEGSEQMNEHDQQEIADVGYEGG